ncbi:MAG: glycyl-radical enzyme activating protein [Tannerellaceae bacterium]|jgi:pyruvate formate lyase activating enzyme|nr:glycyl-radical enzyme activating protein [Tannerellaceae bacterium]
MTTLFFDVKRYAIHDGPGIRITLFLKGCPLSCVWCHNPEGIFAGKEKMYTRKKCIGCLNCVKHCPVEAVYPTPEGMQTNRRTCRLCGRCAEVCPTRAMEISGAAYTADYLMGEIEKEILFIDRSGGGVTFCGGEPLMHPGILLELLRRCGEKGIHRALDTTLYARAEVVHEVMKETDLFLVDLKVMDSGKHRYYCGVPNDRILANLQMVADSGKSLIIRIPLIEGVNADEENITRSAAYLASLAWDPRVVHLLPYHDIAWGKHAKLGSRYNPEGIPLSSPSEDVLERCRCIFRRYGVEAVVGG